MPARRPAQRAFGRDVQRIGGVVVDQLADRAARRERQPDLRIGGAGQRAEALGRDHHHVMAQRLQLAARFGQRAHDAVRPVVTTHR